MKRIHLLISGDVQGVGFRSWIQIKAQDLHLTGWVKNRADGTVEVVAEGEEMNLLKLVQLCQQGPESGRVEQVKVQWLSGTGQFYSFEIF